uniref:WD_REPEATS_REGION domain-containing protein n=1 Tax=Ascaris lumbricoides TaxID=6252 RepID=A0A0M3IK59_ASCLU
MVKRDVESVASSSTDPTNESEDGEGQSSKKPKLKAVPFEAAYLRAIPRALQYEKSFMHRDTISHVIATQTDFIITTSIDGHLKFWKKKHAEGIEFVKHFRCHLRKFSTVSINFANFFVHLYFRVFMTQNNEIKMSGPVFCF